MATEVKAAAEVTVSANVKVAALIVAVVSAGVKHLSAKRQLAEGIRAEADRQGYDKKQASQMVALSYVSAYKMEGETDAKRASFLLRIRPDVSKVIALAYPAKAAELQAAYAFNDKLKDAPKSERIGENTLLEIARGNMTAKQAINGKAAKKAASKLDAVTTPAERFKNSVAGILAMHGVGKDGKLTADEARNLFIEQLTAYSAK
jgi:hypothetical protein